MGRVRYVRYGAALTFILIGWVARASLSPIVGPTSLPFIFFFPAIAAAAWFGGFGPAIVALCGSTAAANYWFTEPIGGFAMKNAADVAAFAAFIFAGTIIIAAIQSIHRRRREAQEAEELVATTLRSIGDAVIVTDGDCRIALLNGEAERLTGWQLDEVKGKPLEAVFRIMHEDTRQLAENPVDKVLQTGRVMGLANHTVLVARNGAEIPIDDSAAPIRTVDGEIGGVVLVFRDVTDQRRSQRALAQLATIVQYSGDAIFTKDLQGTITTWNESAERLFGYRADEIIGKSITALIPSERLDEEQTILARLRAGKAVERMETVRVRKDGRHIPVAISVSPLKDSDGEIRGASKIVHDITEIRAARDALERERELLGTTLASIGDAVIVTDLDGRITFLNNEAERITGWTQNEARGCALPLVFNIINEESRRIVENPVEKVMRTGTVVGLANHTILIAKDGREIPIDDSAAPISHQGGPIHGVVLVFRDITERRRAEDVQRESDRRKDRFLAILSHELRNPLAPIRLAAAMLAKVDGADSQILEYRDVIDRQATQLARLLDDLLDVSRISSGKIVLRRAPVRLGEIVASALEISRPLIDSLEHNLSVAIPPEPIEVDADFARLAQVVSNLLNNAAKYTGKGGEIHLSVERRLGDGVIRVRDNGIGLNRDQLDRIFDMFAQVDQSLEQSQGGLGVGLSLAKNLVELHGGRIVATSPGLGKGSEFTVTLPALAARSEISRTFEHAPHKKPAESKRILIADDNLDSANLLAALLHEDGHEVRAAHDGAMAIEVAMALKPELAFLDIGMPKLNGYEVAKVLRAEFGMNIVLVAITGWGQETDKQLAADAGFDHHLTKPIELELVERLISSVDGPSAQTASHTGSA